MIPTYRLEVACDDMTCTPMVWHVRKRGPTPGCGRPTVENIDRWVGRFERTLQKHFGRFFSRCRVQRARIIAQKTGQVVADWHRDEHRHVRLAPVSRS
jgi:hypothetical protein